MLLQRSSPIGVQAWRAFDVLLEIAIGYFVFWKITRDTKKGACLACLSLYTQGLTKWLHILGFDCMGKGLLSRILSNFPGQYLWIHILENFICPNFCLAADSGFLKRYLSVSTNKMLSYTETYQFMHCKCRRSPSTHVNGHSMGLA